MDTALLERIEKILALSERGIGGERENAKRLLEKILKDQGLTVEDLDDARTVRRTFKIKNKEEKDLFARVLVNKVPNAPMTYYHMKSDVFKKDYDLVGVDLTTAQFAELVAAWEIYKDALAAVRKNIVHAFVARHNLFTPVERAMKTPPKGGAPDKATLAQVAALALALPEVDRKKRITSETTG